MEETLSLSWDAHQKNICSGLSVLQQRGEFVDMTLAADGHHVKVHQMILSLVSPYIRDLISTAKCPHPIIFLNNISYTTLSAILEYVYTGEVQVPKNKLSDVLAAGRALHIKGLRDMEVECNPPSHNALVEVTPIKIPVTGTLREYKENNKHNVKQKEEINPEPMCKIFVNSDNDNDYTMEDMITDETPDFLDAPDGTDSISGNNSLELKNNKELSSPGSAQYTVSNQGNLQVVANRYIYNLRYIQKNRNRFWRCVDYAYKKCPASVYTNEKNEILRRKCSHNHPFHDQKILKKLSQGLIFSAYHEAESRIRNKKNEDNVEIVPCENMVHRHIKDMVQTQTSQNSDTE